MSLHVNFNDALAAPRVFRRARQTTAGRRRDPDWTVDHASYFRAIRIEKTMVAIILMLIVAVAAFYLVAMLAMVVTDKRTDIAILAHARHLAAPRDGDVPHPGQRHRLVRASRWASCFGSLARDTTRARSAAFLERLFRFEIFNSDVYIVTRCPRSCASSRSCGSPASPC